MGRIAFKAPIPTNTRPIAGANIMRSALGRLVVLVAIVIFGVAVDGRPAHAAPAFVQANANEVSSGSTNAVAFLSGNAAGNLIVAYVIWSNGANVTIADSRGNAYVSAVGPTAWGGGYRAQIFYAKSIAAGANTVTATFQTAITSFGLVYIHEYSGIDAASPVDVVAAATGSGAAMNSGSITTTNATDLIFGAGVSSSIVSAAGTGFTLRSGYAGNLTEDRNVPTIGAYSATATQSGSSWAMQMVAFRAAGSGAPPPFDFAMSNGGNKSVVQGASVANTITSTLASGTAALVSYAASGLPTGATAAFSPTSCNPTCNTTLTITTAGSTPTGTSAIVVTGTSGALVHTTSFNLTVTGASDTTPPTVSLSAPANNATVTGTAVTITATASDNVGVSGVQFLLDGANLGAEDTTSPYSISWNTTTASNGAHVLSARARDAAGNTRIAANVNVTVDNQAPTGSVVINGGANATNSRNSTLALSAADALSTVTQMRFSNTGTSYSAAEAYATTKAWTLSAGAGTKQVYVQFKDAPGNWSSAFTDTIILDTTAPTISAVGSANVTANSANINWTTNEPATSQVEYGTTTSYGQLTAVNGSLTTPHTFAVAGLAASTLYNYRVRSRDEAGNERIGTNNTFTTLAGVDTTPPSIPGGLAGNAVSATQINLSWNASTDNVAVTGYNVLRNGALVGSPTTTSFADTALAAATSYGYTVSAHDAAGNVSAPSTAVNVSTLANQPPVVAASANPMSGTAPLVVAFSSAGSSDPEGSALSYSWTFGDGTTSTLANPTHMYAGGGSYAARLTVSDGTSSTTSGALNITVNTTAAGFVNEVVVPDITAATTIAFLPGGRMLVGELTQTIWVVQPGASQADPVPFLQLDYSEMIGEQGLMDIALDPAFDQNGYYYVFYTRGFPGSQNHNRVSRFTASGNGTVPGSESVLWQDDQVALFEHHGGALGFGPDGKLYVSTGDQFADYDAQSLSNYRGKILRINSNGSIPSDNPFIDGSGPNKDEIWAYGLRNPFRMAFDRITGKLYIGDVGGNGGDATEYLYIGTRGANFGWPYRDFGGGPPGIMPPIYAYPHNGRDAAVMGGFVYRGAQFPSEYYGSYFFADYVQNWIKRLTFDANGNVSGVFNFEPPSGIPDGPTGDPVKLVEGPDGALYYVDIGFNDVHDPNPAAIRRIRYVSGNLPPVVAASANPTSGLAPLTVTFSNVGSFDPEGAPLTYGWTFGDGLTSNAANPVHTYSSAGHYTARLTVSDGVNTTLSSDLSINVGNPPSASILIPADNSLFRAGDVISFAGSGTDPEDGLLPASAFSWTIVFHHEGHIHPVAGPITNTKTGVFPIPASGHDFSGNTSYEISLTVTDSSGLKNTASAFVFPQKVNLTFDTIPSGLVVEINGISRLTPFVLDDAVNFQDTINAPNQTSGGTFYAFASWSDGGAQSHGIVVPSVGQSYVATFQSAGMPGLVAAYGFNEGAGATVADASGNGNTGVVTGATWTTGRFGSALSFNGSGNLVTVNDSASLDLTTGMTLEAWVYPTGADGSWRDVIYKFDDAYYLDVINGTAAFGGTFAPTVYGTALPLNSWSHVAATYDGTTLRLYVNGIQVNSQPQTGNILTSIHPLQIGGDSFYGQYFQGRIDEVRIYSVARMQAEIQADMNTPLP